MPVDYTYDAPRNLVRARVHGVIELSDATRHLEVMLADDSIQSAFVEVADFADVEDFRFLYSQCDVFRAAFKRLREEKGIAGTVAYVPTDLQFGVLRMIGAVLDDVHHVVPVRDASGIESAIRDLRPDG